MPAITAAALVLGLPTYLLVSGFLMNRQFSHRLRDYLADPRGQLLGRGGLTAIYGVHLVVLVGLAYAFLLISIVAVVAFGVFGGIAILHLPLIPLILPIALLIVVVASLFGILRGIFATAKVQSLGIAVNNSEEPELWTLSGAVAAEMQTKPATTIVVSPLTGISVHEEGSLLSMLMGRTSRILTVGMPSIVGLTVAQFHAILAHEYGHFSNRDTSWSLLTSRAGSAVEQTLIIMKSTQQSGGWVVAAISFLNPAFWLLTAYQWLFAYISSGFSRMREILADQAAVELAGRSAFKEGLQRVVLNDIMFSSECIPSVIELLKQDKAITDVYTWLKSIQDSASQDALTEVVHQVGTHRDSAFDSHPPLGVRLAFADSVGTRLEEAIPEPLEGTFQSWEDRCIQISELLTYWAATMTGSLEPREDSPLA